MLVSAIVGNEAFDAFADNRYQPRGPIRVAAHRSIAKQSYLRQQPALALGGAYGHRMTERVPLKAGFLTLLSQGAAFLRWQRPAAEYRVEISHRRFGLGVHSGDGACRVAHHQPSNLRAARKIFSPWAIL
jgi:hypothetical protein